MIRDIFRFLVAMAILIGSIVGAQWLASVTEWMAGYVFSFILIALCFFTARAIVRSLR